MNQLKSRTAKVNIDIRFRCLRVCDQSLDKNQQCSSTKTMFCDNLRKILNCKMWILFATILLQVAQYMTASDMTTLKPKRGLIRHNPLGQVQSHTIKQLENIEEKLARLETLVITHLTNAAATTNKYQHEYDDFESDRGNHHYRHHHDPIETSQHMIHRNFEQIHRKLETQAQIFQIKLSSLSTKMDKLEEGIMNREEELSSELSDVLAALDDLKSNDTPQNVSATNKTKSNDFVEMQMKLNEYAVKVAAMNAENWQQNERMYTLLNGIQTSVNQTEMRIGTEFNKLESIAKSRAKLGAKECESQIKYLEQTLNSNFEKIVSAQNLFMDSCYRLQMDESQIELKISEVLEKLVETFEKRSSVETEDIKQMETFIKSHDSRTEQHIQQIEVQVMSLINRISKNHNQFNLDIKKILNYLEALFILVRSNDDVFKLKTLNSIATNVRKIEQKVGRLHLQTTDEHAIQPINTTEAQTTAGIP